MAQRVEVFVYKEIIGYRDLLISRFNRKADDRYSQGSCVGHQSISDSWKKRIKMTCWPNTEPKQSISDGISSHSDNTLPLLRGLIDKKDKVGTFPKEKGPTKSRNKQLCTTNDTLFSDLISPQLYQPQKFDSRDAIFT